MSRIQTKFIANNVVTNDKLSQVASATLKGRKTTGTGNVEDLSSADATSLLNVMVGDSGSGGTKGLVPAPLAGDASKFLRGDGTFANIPGVVSADITPTNWSGLANNTANQTITGFQFANTVKFFEALVDVELDIGSFSAITFKMQARRRGANWATNEIQLEYMGDSLSGIQFSINSSGQVLVTTPNISGFVSGIVTFRAITLS